MTSFIYCVDENTQKQLILKGYKLIKQESMQNSNVWIFQFKPNIQFDITDKTKYFISNKMNF